MEDNKKDKTAITEDYVSLETAKLLKEKGFDVPCQHFYKFDSDEIYRGTVFTNSQIGDKFYNAPTLQMAMKWLRLVHGLHIGIHPNSSDPLFYISISKLDYDEWTSAESDTSLVYTGETIYEKNFASYEDACEEAIKYCVRKLIKN